MEWKRKRRMLCREREKLIDISPEERTRRIVNAWKKEK